jgi:hypothetical protein
LERWQLFVCSTSASVGNSPPDKVKIVSPTSEQPAGIAIDVQKTKGLGMQPHE